jgi:DNA topoisomerase VI subunit B
MQSFGLDSVQLQKVAAVELEILEEKASALGITGRRLEAALAEYRGHRQRGAKAKSLAQLIAEIANNLQELLIQRESMGVPYQNVEWVLRSYDIPQEISAKLGLRDDPDHLFRP